MITEMITDPLPKPQSFDCPAKPFDGLRAASGVERLTGGGAAAPK